MASRRKTAKPTSRSFSIFRPNWTNFSGVRFSTQASIVQQRHHVLGDTTTNVHRRQLQVLDWFTSDSVVAHKRTPHTIHLVFDLNNSVSITCHFKLSAWETWFVLKVIVTCTHAFLCYNHKNSSGILMASSSPSMSSMSSFGHHGALSSGMGPSPGACLQQRDSPTMGGAMSGYCMGRPPSYDLGIGYG